LPLKGVGVKGGSIEQAVLTQLKDKLFAVAATGCLDVASAALGSIAITANYFITSVIV